MKMIVYCVNLSGVMEIGDKKVAFDGTVKKPPAPRRDQRQRESQAQKDLRTHYNLMHTTVPASMLDDCKVDEATASMAKYVMPYSRVICVVSLCMSMSSATQMILYGELASWAVSSGDLGAQSFMCLFSRRCRDCG